MVAVRYSDIFVAVFTHRDLLTESGLQMNVEKPLPE